MMTALEEAAAWFARLQAPDCQPAERVQFEQWLVQHQDNAGAYAAVERLVGEIDAKAPRDPRLLAMAKQALALGGIVAAPPPPRKPLRQRLLPFAAAAGIVVSLAVLLQLPGLLATRTEALVFASATDQQRALTLDDGTQTSLDVDSAVTVKMTQRAREVDLVKGRALFDVAHDPQRPFTVAAGTSRITALGTRFQVQRQDPFVIVTLEEGSVDVVGGSGAEQLREQLKPGEQLRIGPDPATWSKTTVATDSATSWSRGRHVFRSTRLADAVSEVNRYADLKVRLGDPALGELVVSGNFVIGDSKLILSAFAAALPVRVVDGSSELVLFPVYGLDAQAGADRAQ
jgi:transmembrane sensor